MASPEAFPASVEGGISGDAAGPRDRATKKVAPYTLYSSWQRWGYLSILFLVTTSNYFDYYVISIVLDPIKQQFHLSDTSLGMLSGFGFAAVYAFAALPIAKWADRGNRRTLIALTLAGWSVMTAFCGLAQSYTQLMFARLGVALTEPGGAAPAQSLLADFFPPERRATAISLLIQGGSAVGYCIGIVFGGYIAARYGWRMSFLLAALPGLLLAVLVRGFLPEPRCKLGMPTAKETTETTRQSIHHLRGKLSYVLALVSVTSYAVFAYGTSLFLPTFMLRGLHATLEQVSVTWGLTVSVAMVIGALVGGRLADRLGQRDIRYYAWLPAVTYAIGLPLYAVILSTHDIWTFIVVDFPAETVLAIGFSVSFSAIHVVCGSTRRATAIAIAYFFIMLLGCGLGPFLAGVISDSLSATYGQESIRYALLCMVLFLVPANICLLWGGKAMPGDVEH